MRKRDNPKITSLPGLLLILVGTVTLAVVLFQTALADGPDPIPTPPPQNPLVTTTDSIIYLPIVFRRMEQSNPPPAGNPHLTIMQYDGPQTCITCHAEEANHALNSEHLQWKGKWEQINTYCTAPKPADYACLSCHTTTGKVTDLTINDVDCLVCHQDTYQRSLGPLSVPVTVTDWQGNSKTYNTPQKNNQGAYQFQPRFDLMPPGTTMVELARTVHLPTRATCLRCHAKAGGGDGVKRGDLSTVSINPPYVSDVHLSPSGADMVCQDCHTVTDHQIPGRGIDLRIAEGGSVKPCSDCHSSTPHDSSRLNRHTNRVACQTCHIPRYARDIPTEMSRDWRQPVWNPAGCNGQGAWIGEEVKASNVLPAYRFWNGQSDVYDLQNPINSDPDGMYTMARALGSIQEGKLFPIKIHTAYQPRHNISGRMVQYDVLWNFMTGFFEQAASRGVTFMGLNGAYSWVETRAEQLITHGVAPSDNALECAACHNNGPQMNLEDLGYTLNGPTEQVCTQCHGAEDDDLDWQRVHSIHVDEERRDCSWCHNFTRPERNLRLP